MSEEVRYVKCKVRNLDRKRGSKHRDIYTNNADGTLITIQDGAEVELTEYAYNNLNDAVEIIIRHVDQGPGNHPKKVEEPYQRYDVVKLGDFYIKGKVVEAKVETPVVEKKEVVKPMENILTMKEELGIGLNPTEDQKKAFIEMYNEDKVEKKPMGRLKKIVPELQPAGA